MEDGPLAATVELPPAHTSSSGRPRSVARRLLTTLLWLAIGVGAAFALWTIWRDASVTSLPSDLHPASLALSIALRIAATLLTVFVWLGLFWGLGGSIDASDGFRIYLLTNLGKYLPGKVMHAAGRVALLRERGESTSAGVTSILLELLVSLLAAGLVSVMSIPLLLRSQGLEQYATLVSVGALLSVPVGLTVLHPKVLGIVLKLVARKAPAGGGPLAHQLPTYRRILGLVALYALVWIVGACALYAAARSVYDLDIAWLPAMGGIAAASYVAGLAVPFAPAGLGAREGLMTLLLSTMMPAPAAAIVAVLYRLASVAAELASAGLTLAVRAVRASVSQPPLPARGSGGAR
ncbi:MAG: flippase-like domain-containing protein [Chloroflexi bacterium]|nr:flippase-like domain-containing protein [Chloroflexota bacterium]